MTRAPWRPMDMADALLGRDSRPEPPMAWVEDGPLPDSPDMYIAIQHPIGDTGRVQVVVWPMRNMVRGPQDGRA